MLPSLSILIPTIGRPELARLLGELMPQLSGDDEILVIGDGPQPEARDMATASGPRAQYHEFGPAHCWGHPQRNWAMALATGTHLMSFDDDDRCAPTALRDVRRAAIEHPGRPLMFREHHEGTVIWTEPSLRVGNVGTQIFVAPNVRGRIGRWGDRYEGDYDFVESTLQLYPEGEHALVWRPEVIAVHGTIAWKAAVDAWSWSDGSPGSVATTRPTSAEARSIESLEDYWQRGFPHVEGWVDARLLECLRLIDATQRGAGVAGHVGEIGVYHGKFLIALAYLADPGDKVTAIDVFEDQAKNIDGAGVGSREIVQRNIGTYAPGARDYSFIKADSIALTPSDIQHLMSTRGPFRLFSVDGCHTVEHTCNDLLTAQDVLAPGGIIILDDYMQPHWPGVTEAVNMFYSRHVPRVKPFLYCCHKLFLVGYGWHADFFRACEDHLGGRSDVRVVEMFGTRVVSLYP